MKIHTITCVRAEEKSDEPPSPIPRHAARYVFFIRKTELLSPFWLSRTFRTSRVTVYLRKVRHVENRRLLLSQVMRPPIMRMLCKRWRTKSVMRSPAADSRCSPRRSALECLPRRACCAVTPENACRRPAVLSAVRRIDVTAMGQFRPPTTPPTCRAVYGERMRVERRRCLQTGMAILAMVMLRPFSLSSASSPSRLKGARCESAPAMPYCSNGRHARRRRGKR